MTAAETGGGFLLLAGDVVRRVSHEGQFFTVAGTNRTPPQSGFSGDGGPATAALLDRPSGVAVLSDGGLLIADCGKARVRRVWPDGHISTVAGDGSPGFGGDGGTSCACWAVI